MVFDTTILGSNPSAPAIRMIIKKPNLTFIRKAKNFFFPFYKSNEIKLIFKILEKNEPTNKKIAMFVGGCVRKHLLNEEVDDIDIATVLKPDEIKEKFKNSDIKIIESGIEHGTLTLLLNDLKFEITTLRKDIKTDGRHAEVNFTEDWLHDSQRRDFSINAIYLDKDGKIFDPQAGVDDLKNNIIKFIGNPNLRIEEDYLRIIRFIRFSIQYKNNLVDSSVINSIKLNLGGITKLSKERIFSELIKIFKLKNFDQILQLNELKILFSLIFPEFRYIHRLNKLNLVLRKKINKNNTILILAVLLIDETNNHEYFCHKYKTSNEIRDKLSLIAKSFTKYKLDNNYLKRNLRRNIYFLGKDTMQELVLFLFVESTKMNEKNLVKYITNIKEAKIPKFPFDGRHILKTGITEGKKIGIVLKKLEEKWIENNFSLSEESQINIINNLKD